MRTASMTASADVPTALPRRGCSSAAERGLLLALAGLTLAGLAGFDQQALEWLAATWSRHDWLRGAAQATSRLGRGGWMTGGAVLLMVVWRWWVVRPRLAAFCVWLLASQASVGLVTRVLKVFAGRGRPWGSAAGEFAFMRFDAAYHSFPSGHVADAAVLATVLWCACPRWRGVWVGWGVLMALARVFAGAHFPSDVACAALLAVPITLALRRRWWPGLCSAETSAAESQPGERRSNPPVCASAGVRARGSA